MTATALPVESIDFGGLHIQFDARVLRPRGWTTAQSLWAADLLRDVGEGAVLELCSGAGHIGLLTVVHSRRRLVCVDMSSAATTYTRLNAARNGLAERVTARQASLREALDADERFPLILADPPWVQAHQTCRFPDDPPLAIDGGNDGLRIARECIAVIASHLGRGGRAVIQLGDITQAATLVDELDGDGELAGGEIRTYGDRGVLLSLCAEDVHTPRPGDASRWERPWARSSTRTTRRAPPG